LCLQDLGKRPGERYCRAAAGVEEGYIGVSANDVYDAKTGYGFAKSEAIENVPATIKKLKAGKKYYVRIRTHKKVGKKKYYSKWSARKTVKVKE
jgi:hypothetical protein